MGSLTLLRNSDFMQSERPGRIFQRRAAALLGRGRLVAGAGAGGGSEAMFVSAAAPLFPGRRGVSR